MAGPATAIRLRQFVDPAPNVPLRIIHHQGKDVCGYYPGQTARVHVAYPPERQLGPFTILKSVPPPVKREIVPQYDFDYIILKRYIHSQRTKKKSYNWYTQTTYRDAFTFPSYESDTAKIKGLARTEAESLSVWKSTSAMKRGKVKPSFMGIE
ncbi:protein SPMIP3 [Paroedura picta]|uniref:protein SPMIP3 n=1 Tax=Paroedura picta TaxID=143630 RepID=UPI0040574B80